MQAAIDSVNRYLSAAGREGKYYRVALELLVKAERKLQELAEMTDSNTTDAGMDPRQAEAVVAAISRADAELATKADLSAVIDKLEARIWRIGVTIAGLAVLINKFLDWMIR